MRYIIKNQDTGETLVDKKLDEYETVLTNVNGNLDEATIYVKRKNVY